MTNFEKIKAMSEEELALFLKNVEDGAVRAHRYGYLPKSSLEKLAWLRREAPEI